MSERKGAHGPIVSEWAVASWRFARATFRPIPSLSNAWGLVVAALALFGIAVGALTGPLALALSVASVLLLASLAGIRRERERLVGERVQVRLAAERTGVADVDACVLKLRVANRGPTGRFSARVLRGVKGTSPPLDEDYGNFQLRWENSIDSVQRIYRASDHSLEVARLHIGPFVFGFLGPKTSYSGPHSTTNWYQFCPSGPIEFQLEIREVDKDVPTVWAVRIDFDPLSKWPCISVITA